jgi:hypothetical protein
LNARGEGGMIEPCGLGTHNLGVACQDALGLPAGAPIAAPGGRKRGKGVIVPTASCEKGAADA